MTKVANLKYPNQALKKVSEKAAVRSNTDNSVVFKNTPQNQEIAYTPFKAYFYRIHLRKLYNIKHPY